MAPAAIARPARGPGADAGSASLSSLPGKASGAERAAPVSSGGHASASGRIGPDGQRLGFLPAAGLSARAAGE